MSDGADGRVEVWVKIQKDADGYPKSQDWEDLWAWSLPSGNLQIDNIPFFANDVALGDIITATRTEEGVWTLDRKNIKIGVRKIRKIGVRKNRCQRPHYRFREAG
jgi:hypothetical protein